MRATQRKIETLTEATPIGTKTNFGILTHFKNGFAYFDQNGRENWAGKDTWDFVQIKELPDSRLDVEGKMETENYGPDA